jgi:iron only hydrogenase large subunit-like protein
MMGVINFSKANCKNCYSCVRSCHVHAVRIRNEQAEIMEERCIACGKCLKVCPKNAKEIMSELYIVKNLIYEGYRVAVSIAPSFAAAFGSLSGRICSALKKLGVSYVEETVIGAEAVTKEYERYSRIIDEKCYITTSCPAVNSLIKIHNPDLIENLIPIISPMECHGRILKQKYGQDVKIVFIGPCLAKKIEAKEDNTIDAVLTFEELKRWFNDTGIRLSEIDEMSFDSASQGLHRYPIVGGVTHGFTGNVRELIHIDGIEDCMEAMEAIKRGSFKNALLEMNMCRHGCINGPAMPDDSTNVYERRQLIRQYALNRERENPVCDADKIHFDLVINKEFKAVHFPVKEPTEKEIKEILISIGKNTKGDELNCGTCGYKTCREKAVAVYNKMAEPTMCLPFMRQKAETLSNIIFDVTPNIIVIIDKWRKVLDINPSAERFFSTAKNMALGLPLNMLMDIKDSESIIESRQNLYGRKMYMPFQDATVLQSIIWIENHEATLFIMQDISESVKREEKLKSMKINSIEMAQKVIDKQMIVAQQIASLLGETTAETKVSLTKLKRLMQGEEVEVK